MAAKKKQQPRPVATLAPDLVEKPLAWFKPFAQNPKEHPKAQIKALRKAIDDYGPTVPILADEQGEIIAGHGRKLAAELPPALKTFPTRIAIGWTENQKRAYRIADNRLAELGRWNEDLLRTELAQLNAEGFDLGAIGFDLTALTEFKVPGFTQAEQNQPAEETPPRPKAAVVKPGELWMLGAHRLLIGDSTKPEDVARAVAKHKPMLMVTDPPYGVGYDPNWRNEADRANGKAYGARAIGKVENDDCADWTPTWRLFAGDIAYVWHADRHARTVQESLEAAGFVMRSQIIWAKDRMIISRGDYHWQHEPCWYVVRSGKRGNFVGGRSQTTLWQIEHRKSDTGHGTQKPIECMRRPIANNSKRGDWVYDPFLGSGTTLMAAEMEGRKCIGIEIDPGYAEVTIERWEKFTGKTAKRDDGRTLAELRKAKPRPARPAKAAGSSRELAR